MNKKLVACIAVAALIVLATRLVGLWGGASSRRGSASVGSAEATGGSTVAAVPSVASAAAAQRMPEFAHDDDPIGTIRLEGQVIDAADQPVAGVLVAIDSNPTMLATTDASGGFVFDGLIAREYRVEATNADGYAGPTRVKVVADAEPITLRLKPGGTVEVSVIDAISYAPIAGAEVELRATLTYRAVTDAKGVATLRHVGANFAPILARAPGYAMTATMLTTSGEAASPVTITLGLAKGAAVQGRVVDERGKAVAGAQVSAVAASAPFPVTDARRDGVLSKADGTFALTTLPAGTWRLTATHSTYSPATAPPIIVDGEHAKVGVELVLVAGAVVKGKVVDKTGAGIAGANVRAVVRGNTSWREQRQAFTAADGSFSIGGLSRRDIELVATHQRGSSAIAAIDLTAKATAECTLTIDVLGVIAGIVVDPSGLAVGDAQVIAEPLYDGGVAARAAWTVRGVQQVVTDQGGGFVLTGLPDGVYRVRAARPGAPESALDLAKSTDVRPGGPMLTLVLATDSAIIGKVAFRDGTAPRAFTVALGSSFPMPFATADGSFKLPAPTGLQTIVVDGKSFLAAKAHDVTVTAGKPADVGTIIVEPGRSVSGRVLDEAGLPIAGAKVAAGVLLTGGGQELYIPDESIGAKDTVTDRNGRYRLEGFSPVPITIVAGNDTIGRSASVQLPAGSDSATVDLILQKTTGLDGIIIREGKPLGDTIVIANPVGASHANFFSVTGADGTFALDALAPGTYIVYPIIGGGGMRPKDMYIVKTELVIGKRARVTIDASPGPVTIAVKVTTPAGAPVPMAQLFLIQAKISATNSAELRDLDQLGAFSDKPIPLHLRAAMAGTGEITNVRVGAHTLCVVPLQGPPDPNGPPLPATCQAVTVAGGGPQGVTVVVPNTVPMK